MKTVRVFAFMTVLGIALFNMPGMSYGNGGFSLNIATDDFYLSVGGYDYCNYYDNNFAGDLYAPHGPGMSFHTILNDYGQWVYYGQLGNVWVPWVAVGWRPYMYGQWTLTPYGWTWVSYEPWGWIPHHYGHWLFTPAYGWVWVPGYEYHPAGVTWITCGNYIGWSPIPPMGYHHHRGPWRGNYGFYHKPIYVSNVYINNYVLIENRYFTSDNVYGHYASRGNAGDVFAKEQFRLVQMPKGPDRYAVERFTGKKVEVHDVDLKKMNINGRNVVYHRPKGAFESVQHYANSTIEQSIAPAFAEQKIAFKGKDSPNAKSINRLFKQENKQIKTRSFKPSGTSRAAAGKAAKPESSGMRAEQQRGAAKGKTGSQKTGTSKSMTKGDSKPSSSGSKHAKKDSSEKSATGSKKNGKSQATHMKTSSSETKGYKGAASKGKEGKTGSPKTVSSKSMTKGDSKPSSSGSKKNGKSQATHMQASSSGGQNNKKTSVKGKEATGSRKHTAASADVKDAAKGKKQPSAGKDAEKTANGKGHQGKSASSDQGKNKKGKK